MTSAHRAALVRARDRIAELEVAERAYLETAPYRLVHAHDMRGGLYKVRVEVLRPVPDEAALLAAGVVRELGEALDGIATTLAGAPTRFPIHESLTLFAQRSRKAIARMSDEAQATLEDLQPYHAIGGFRNGHLWTLQQLAAAETPPLAAGGIREGGTLGVNTQRMVAIIGEPAFTLGAFDDGAIVASVPTKVAGPDPKLDMFLRVDYGLAYARQGPGRGGEVVALLAGLCDHVEHTVLPALESSDP